MNLRIADKLRLAGLLCVTLSMVSSGAQPPAAPRWTALVARASESHAVTVLLKAEIPQGWHIYAASQPQGGPLPLVIRPEPGSPYQLDGKIQGTVPTRHHDASFDLDTEYYTGSLALTVPVKFTLLQGSPEVPLAVRFQMCSDTICLPPRTIHLVAKQNT